MTFAVMWAAGFACALVMFAPGGEAAAVTHPCTGHLASPEQVASGKFVVRVAATAESVDVYQAFSEFTARHAVRDQTFAPGGGFKLERMTWLKLSFGWMLHRSGYATKPRQERVLKMTIPRHFFDRLLAVAEAASHDPSFHADKAAWRRRLATSDVIYQWDPDRDLRGDKIGVRVLQLGIRGGVAEAYARGAITRIEDVTDLVHRIRAAIDAGEDLPRVPSERPYP